MRFADRDTLFARVVHGILTTVVILLIAGASVVGVAIGLVRRLLSAT